MPEEKTAVKTFVKDSFFDDPFFSDWWKEFDVPEVENYEKKLDRQPSGTYSNIIIQRHK
jgi:hypothetical protein